jgi:hypothetical protein
LLHCNIKRIGLRFKGKQIEQPDFWKFGWLILGFGVLAEELTSATIGLNSDSR